MKSQTIEELMMFLCTSKFDMEEQEAKLLEKFFSHEELEAAKEEKEEKLGEVEVNPISDTEEQEDEIDNEIELGEASSATGKHDAEPEPSLPQNCTQTRASGRKRKRREDDIFEYH